MYGQQFSNIWCINYKCIIENVELVDISPKNTLFT